MKSISDQQIDAFVDGQLSQAERLKILAAMEESSDIRNQVAETRRLKELIQLAYQDEKPKMMSFVVASKKYSSHAVAAVLGALAMLVFLELVVTPAGLMQSAQNPQLARVPDDVMSIPASARTPEQVLFHLTSGNKQIARELLDQVELVASEYRKTGRDIRILVVTNNEGLRLYQAAYTAHAGRIRELYTRFDNIVFAACGNTMGRHAAAGDDTELLPEVIVVDSGVAELTRRQLQGWKYIRI